MRRPVLSLVLPIFNEESVIPELHARLQGFLRQLALETEVIFVDDGSHDRSLEMLRALAAAEPRYRVLSFARNFGHQAAITAGLDHAHGEAVGGVGADLPGPPEGGEGVGGQWGGGLGLGYGRGPPR